MRFLALIAARGGSRRVPRKNVRPLGGKPLIQWTIDLAMKIGPSVDVMVSTDDAEIASVATAAGAWVPRLRPAHLSDDTATSLDVALHELDHYQAARQPVDGLILLQPTSPFRQLSTVLEGIRLFEDSGGSPVVGLCPAATHPAWCFAVKDGAIVRYSENSDFPTRSQDLAPAFQISGGLYIIAPNQLREDRTFFPRNAQPLVTEDEIEALDIDTEWDWLCAEKALEAGLVQSGPYAAVGEH